MTITIFPNGNLVVPKEIRERAGIAAGDELEISVENGRIQLEKKLCSGRKRLKIKINKDTGMPYFDVPKDAPPITSEWVREQLAKFP